MGKGMARRDKKIAVAFIEQEARLGGVETTTLQLVTHLSRERFYPVVICPYEGELTAQCRQSGIEVNIVPRPAFTSVSIEVGTRYITNPFALVYSAFACWRAVAPLERHLCASEVDVVVTKGLLAHFYGGEAAHRLGLPCVWYMQEQIALDRAGGLYPRVLNWAARRTANYFAVDAIAMGNQFCPDLHQEGRIITIYNGVDIEKFRPASDTDRILARQQLGMPLDAIVVGHVGRVVMLKGQHVLIEAFSRLAAGYPELHLLLVGAPTFASGEYEARLKRMVSDLGLDSRIHFAGFQRDVVSALAAMDIFVHPSIEPDSPVSVLEALACGKPAILSAVDGTKELVEDGINALLVRPGDAAQLAEFLSNLIADPERRAMLALAARNLAASRYAIHASTAQFEQVLERAVTNRAG